MRVRGLLKVIRHFGGKAYLFAGSFHYHSEACREALRQRNKGRSARMTFRKTADAYEVWVS